MSNSWDSYEDERIANVPERGNDLWTPQFYMNWMNSHMVCAEVMGMSSERIFETYSPVEVYVKLELLKKGPKSIIDNMFDVHKRNYEEVLGSLSKAFEIHGY